MKKNILSLMVILFTSFSAHAGLFDLQLNFNVEDSSGFGGQAAVIFTGTEFWSAQWNSNVFSRFDNTGSFIDTFTIAGLSGTRGMVLNGSELYVVNNTDTVFEVDIVSKTINSTIILPTQVRHVTFDPSANAGAGGLWAGFWGADFVLYDLNGNVLNTITSATHGFTSVYSTAYDAYTAGGPYLWVFHQGGLSSEAEIDRIEIATGNRANINLDIDLDLGYTNSLAGGLFISDALVIGQWTIGGMLQTNPDNIFAYELNDLVLPDYDVETSVGEINDGLTQYPLNHAQSNLTIATVLENKGGLTLDSTNVNVQVFDAANVLVYEEDQVFYNIVSGSITNVNFVNMMPIVGSFTTNIESEILGFPDSIPTNNSVSFDFQITENQMARIDENVNTGAYLVNGDAWAHIVARYDLTVTDSLGSINISFLNPNIGDTTYGMIFSNSGNLPGTLIARTPDYIIDESEMDLWFSDTVELAAGSYFFGVYEATFTGIRLAQSNNNFRAGVNFFRTSGGNWTTSSIETARAINPKFNWDEVNCNGYSTSLEKTPGNVFLGDIVTLTATPSDPNTNTIEWKFSNTTIPGANALTYDYTAASIGFKNFEVLIEADNDCTSSKTLSFQVLDTAQINPNVSIINGEKLDFINVYPNPVSKNLTIELNDFKENYREALIIDLNGKSIKEFPLNRNGKTNISVANISKGIYILEILSKENTITKQIVVE